MATSKARAVADTSIARCLRRGPGALRARPGWLAAGLAAALGVLPGCAGVARTQLPAAVAPETTVRIRALADTVAEGATGAFRVSRDTGEGTLEVRLSVSGTATFGTDYTVRGAERFEATGATVAFADGQTSVDLIVSAVDDVAAEPDEAVTLALVRARGYGVDAAAGRATMTIPQNDFGVTSLADEGEGSLRQAIINAHALPGPHAITFDATVGPFAEPQTIVLTRELPELVTDLTIDGYIPGRLWLPTGVTVSGEGRFRVFKVGAGGRVTISSLTIADGRADDGGGVSNSGTLVLKGVTLRGNVALNAGGGVANDWGTVTVINSTFADNTAGDAGGGLVNRDGIATVTNGTFSGSRASRGGGLFSRGTLLLRNTILANSVGGVDCVATGALDPASTHNLIQASDGCGTPVTGADPRLGALGAYNGPTWTFPLHAGSPAINLGDNAAARDEFDQPLQWDQRGNGDPRVVGGFTDIGAFEHQSVPVLTVDTVEDPPLRGCTPAPADCPLRAAIELANVTKGPALIKFDPKVFAGPRTIVLTRPLPDLTTDVTIDASGTGGVTVSGRKPFKVFNVAPGVEVKLIQAIGDDGASP